MTTPMAYFISSSSSTTSLPSLPTSGGWSSRRLMRIATTVQIARHQGGRTAIETKSRVDDVVGPRQRDAERPPAAG